MRIVHLHVDLPPQGRGGVAYQVDLLARTQVALGHEVRIISTTPGPSDAPYEVDVVSNLEGHFRRVRRQYAVAVGFRRADLGRHDAVHAHGDDWLLPREDARVRTFYGSALHEARTATSMLRKGAQLAQHRLEYRSARLASVAVAISAHSRAQLPGVDRVIPCAVDDTALTVAGRPAPTQDPSILYVAGSLGGRKRGSLLVSAFADVRRRWPGASLHLVTRDHVAAPGVTCYARLGADELAELYLRSWVYASPSSYEGFGVPYAEALTAGLPVVACQNPGADEVLDEGRLGCLTSSDRFAADLVGLLADEERREKLAAAGRNAAVRYASATVAEQYLELYRSLAR